MPDDQPVVNIWLGYEALGLFQRPESGIFEFLKAIPFFALQNNIGFLMPSEVAKKIEAVDILSSPEPISWSGIEKDISLWNGNDLQQEALNKLYAVGERVRLCSDRPLRHDWLMLQSSDHFRYMSHKDAFGTYYESPYDAFMNYMNILADFLLRVDEQYPTTIDNEELNALLNTIYELEKEVESLENELKKLRSRKKRKAKIILMVHEFEKSLVFEKSQFHELIIFIVKCYMLTKSEDFQLIQRKILRMQLQDIDVELIKNNQAFNVSEKFRDKDFGDLYLEVFSKYPHTRGWLETGSADMLVYFVPEAVYCCNAQILRKFCVNKLFPEIPDEWYKEIFCSDAAINSKNLNFFGQQTIIHLIKANNQTADGNRWCTIGISVSFDFLKK
jgi:hypothetical protein